MFANRTYFTSLFCLSWSINDFITFLTDNLLIIRSNIIVLRLNIICFGQLKFILRILNLQIYIGLVNLIVVLIIL